jgi:ubiquinone/menaquinone biosynthesis C-methylase UbiE
VSDRMTATSVRDTTDLYDRVAPGYQRWWAPVIAPAALHLLDLVAPAVVDRRDALIVDVGAGTGTLARAAVSRWPSIRVVAIDPSQGMLATGGREATRTLTSSQARRLDWRTGTAERLPLADRSVDAVVSSFAFQYLPSRSAALREACRVLRPGGMVAVVTWLAADRPFEPWDLYEGVVRDLGLERPESSRSTTRPFRSPSSAAALVRRGGFRRVHAFTGIVEKQWSLDAYVATTFEAEDRDFVAALDPRTRARLESLWRERLARLGPAAFHYRDPIVYATGRRPAG